MQRRAPTARTEVGTANLHSRIDEESIARAPKARTEVGRANLHSRSTTNRSPERRRREQKSAVRTSILDRTRNRSPERRRREQKSALRTSILDRRRIDRPSAEGANRSRHCAPPFSIDDESIARAPKARTEGSQRRVRSTAPGSPQQPTQP